MPQWLGTIVANFVLGKVWGLLKGGSAKLIKAWKRWQWFRKIDKEAAKQVKGVNDIVKKIYMLEEQMETMEDNAQKQEIKKQIKELENDLRKANRNINNKF